MSNSAAEAARNIVANMKRQYSAPQTMVVVEETKFPHLKLDDYGAFRSMMAGEGFRRLADVEILEVSRSPTSVIAPTMIRIMVSDDGYIISDYYQVMPNIGRRLKYLLLGLLNLRFIDAPRGFIEAMKTKHCSGFETELEGGRFLVTTNAQGAAMLSGPPSIETIYFPYGTPRQLLLAAHRNRLLEIMHEEGGAKPLAVRTLAAMLQMQQRMKAVKNAHRAAAQWVTRDELQNMSSGNPELADEIFEEVQKLLARERAPT